MSKAERLIEMMITINVKRNFTLRELADEFSVSKRTILRDLQVLDRIGFPFYSEVGAGGGYHVLKERILPPITFSESEAKAIFCAYQSLAFYRDLPFEEEGISVLNKFLNCLPSDMQHNIDQMKKKIVFWIPDRHCETPLLKELLNIVMNDHAVEIKYSSKYNDTIRKIIPIGLYSMNGLWYLPAYCEKTKKMRDFRADRIKEIIKVEEVIDKEIQLPGSIHEYFKHETIDKDYHLKIMLTDIGVKHCESESLLAKSLVRLKEGGYIELDISKATLDWVADYLLQLGNNATVLEPMELKSLMKKKVQDLYLHYYQ